MGTMIAGIFRTKPTVPLWHVHQARPSVAIATCALTRRGYAIETTIVKTNGTRAKRCVTIRPAKPTVSAVHQGIVFPCVGTAMERMTVETGVMKGPVEQRTRHALVSSSHVAMVCFVPYSVYTPGLGLTRPQSSLNSNYWGQVWGLGELRFAILNCRRRPKQGEEYLLIVTIVNLHNYHSSLASVSR